MLLDTILDSLPQANSIREGLSRGKDAMVYIDASGALTIIIDDIGVLSLQDEYTTYLDVVKTGDN